MRVIHLLSILTPWLIVSTPIPAEVSTKQKTFEPGCLQCLNRATRERWRPSSLQCQIVPASEKKCFDTTIVLTSWHQIVLDQANFCYLCYIAHTCLSENKLCVLPDFSVLASRHSFAFGRVTSCRKVVC